MGDTPSGEAPARPTDTGAAPAPTRLALSRSHRLTRGQDLDAVRREGKRVRTEHLEVRAVASLLRHARVGVIVPKYKHSAVDRNRLKRRLKELARTRLLPLVPPLDVVIRPRPEAYAASFAALGRDVERATRELVKRGRGEMGVGHGETAT